MKLGQEAKDAAWYYPKPKTERAEKIKDYIAFCKLRPFSYTSGCLLLTKLDKSKLDVKVE